MLTLEGNLKAGGRIKEQINRAGEKIMPEEIEYYLCKHPYIKEAVVVGIPDDELGNRICSFIITEEGTTVGMPEIHQFLKRIGIATYKMPDQIENIEVWPLTSVGKIDKKILKKWCSNKRSR